MCLHPFANIPGEALLVKIGESGVSFSDLAKVFTMEYEAGPETNGSKLGPLRFTTMGQVLQILPLGSCLGSLTN